jgi:zinc/manganese transport system ATP-binding protein
MVAPANIRLDRVTLRHGARDAIQSLSGSFAPGSLTAIVGPNGAGKTTLIRALAGLHPIAAGAIDRGGMAASDIALLPQGSELDRGFPIACADVVALGFAPSLGAFRGISRRQRSAVDDALAAVGLLDHGGRPIGNLSAGQFQRVLFARMMLRDSPVLLLDEPFSAVDTTTACDLLAIVDTWRQRGQTVVVVLHDLDLAREAFPQTLLLAKHAIAWGPTGHTLTDHHLQHAGLIHMAWACTSRRHAA